MNSGRELAEKIMGISADHIMIAATHTHGGDPTVKWASGRKELIRCSSNPELIKKLLKTASETDPEYLLFLSYKIASAVILADKHKTNTKCTVGEWMYRISSTEEDTDPSGGGYETRMGMHSFLIPLAGRIIVDESIKLVNNLTLGSF
ncbi:hypothetical protein J7K07_04230 [Candidatus Bathyarchaeota archaeon]|nr:hypothetical protein [Candidatus Bathyarchaeota archaeon]